MIQFKEKSQKQVRCPLTSSSPVRVTTFANSDVDAHATSSLIACADRIQRKSELGFSHTQFSWQLTSSSMELILFLWVGPADLAKRACTVY